MPLHGHGHPHVIVTDLAAATAFFLHLGLEVLGEGAVQGALVDRANGRADVRVAVAMVHVPAGQAPIELIHFATLADAQGMGRPRAHTPGIRHIAFAVDDSEAMVATLKQNGVACFSEIQAYAGRYTVCLCRGPAGMILELDEQIT
jgi:catechol 2,3-dioxygenase-like lactoylglutathione lyase family enzyme